MDLSSPTPGIYGGIPAENYHAAPGLSVSRLKRFAEAPAKARVQRPDTPALILGSLLHTAILEPEELEARYYVTDLDRISEREKATQAEIEKAQGRELVKRPDFDEALRIRDAVFAHPVARDLIVPGDDFLIEQSFWWIDPETGLLLRGRADGTKPRMKVLVDVKSTTDASQRGFSKAVGEYRYHWQNFMYLAGVEAAAGWRPDAFIFLALEKEEPYLVGAYEVSPADIERGAEQVRAHLRRYAECERANHWPGYSDTLETIRVPEWALI